MTHRQLLPIINLLNQHTQTKARMKMKNDNEKSSIISKEDLNNIFNALKAKICPPVVIELKTKNWAGDDVTEYQVNGTLTTIFKIAPQLTIEGKTVEKGEFFNIVSIVGQSVPSVELLKKDLNESVGEIF